MVLSLLPYFLFSCHFFSFSVPTLAESKSSQSSSVLYPAVQISQLSHLKVELLNLLDDLSFIKLPPTVPSPPAASFDEKNEENRKEENDNRSSHGTSFNKPSIYPILPDGSRYEFSTNELVEPCSTHPSQELMQQFTQTIVMSNEKLIENSAKFAETSREGSSVRKSSEKTAKVQQKVPSKKQFAFKETKRLSLSSCTTGQ